MGSTLKVRGLLSKLHSPSNIFVLVWVGVCVHVANLKTLYNSKL